MFQPWGSLSVTKHHCNLRLATWLLNNVLIRFNAVAWASTTSHTVLNTQKQASKDLLYAINLVLWVLLRDEQDSSGRDTWGQVSMHSLNLPAHSCQFQCANVASSASQELLSNFVQKCKFHKPAGSSAPSGSGCDSPSSQTVCTKAPTPVNAWIIR